MAVLIATLLFVPNLIWLIRHGFPFLEFERHSRQSDSRILRGPVSFLVDQARIMNPVLTPLWLAGLAWFFAKGGKALLCIGLAAAFVILILLVMQAKNYYVSPIYPVLLSGGAIFRSAGSHNVHGSGLATPSPSSPLGACSPR